MTRKAAGVGATTAHAEGRAPLRRRRRRPLAVAVAPARQRRLERRRRGPGGLPRRDPLHPVLAGAPEPAPGHLVPVPAGSRRRPAVRPRQAGHLLRRAHARPRRARSTGTSYDTFTTQPQCDDVQGPAESMAAFVASNPPGNAFDRRVLCARQGTQEHRPAQRHQGLDDAHPARRARRHQAAARPQRQRRAAEPGRLDRGRPHRRLLPAGRLRHRTRQDDRRARPRRGAQPPRRHAAPRPQRRRPPVRARRRPEPAHRRAHRVLQDPLLRERVLGQPRARHLLQQRSEAARRGQLDLRQRGLRHPALPELRRRRRGRQHRRRERRGLRRLGRGLLAHDLERHLPRRLLRLRARERQADALPADPLRPDREQPRVEHGALRPGRPA